MKYPANTLCGASWLLAALLLALPATPAAAEHDRDGVTLYEDVHFRGQSETFYGDVPSLRETWLGNDRASSLAVPYGCRVTLYRDAGFYGPSITVRHDVADLRGSWVGNDEVSSLRVDCDRRDYGRSYDGPRYGDRRYDPYRDDDRRDGHRGRHSGGVTVFSDADFRGYSESFRYDDPDLQDNPIRQDTISSVHVAPGCRAVLFEDVGFRGAATVVTGGADDLRYTTVGNDRVSSIQVDCRGRR